MSHAFYSIKFVTFINICSIGLYIFTFLLYFKLHIVFSQCSSWLTGGAICFQMSSLLLYVSVLTGTMCLLLAIKWKHLQLSIMLKFLVQSSNITMKKGIKSYVCSNSTYICLWNLFPYDMFYWFHIIFSLCVLVRIKFFTQNNIVSIQNKYIGNIYLRMLLIIWKDNTVRSMFLAEQVIYIVNFYILVFCLSCLWLACICYNTFCCVDAHICSDSTLCAQMSH